MSKFKEILKEKGITQRELAKRTGISYQLLNYFAVGRSDITLRKAKRIADELNIKVDDLI